MIAKGENTSELSITTRGGQIVFLEIGVGLGAFTNRAHLYEVDPKEGKAAVMQTRLVK